MRYLVVILLSFCSNSWALDNPDTPDYVGDFEARIAPLERFVREEAASTLQWSGGYADLEDALDKELNGAYKQLIEKLPKESRKNLRNSQKAWLKFRDAEFEFLSENFTRERFGSSFVISIGSYRTEIIKTRVKELLWYLKNYES